MRHRLKRLAVGILGITLMLSLAGAASDVTLGHEPTSSVPLAANPMAGASGIALPGIPGPTGMIGGLSSSASPAVTGSPTATGSPAAKDSQAARGSPAVAGSPGADASAATPTPTGTTETPPPAGASAASPILLYAQDWNSYPSARSTAAWKEAAVTHQILVGSPGPVYGDMITQLHAWNPGLKVLVYDLGPYTIAGSSEYATLMSEHPDYFARDAHGNLITMAAANGSPAFPNNTLMDEGNPGWQAWEAQRVASNIAAWGFDGAYIDSIGLGVLTGSTTGVPIDPSTGKAYTSAQWMEAGSAALDAIKAAIGSKFLFSAGLVNGAEYQASSNVLADSTADGFQTNSWMRLSDASLTAWPSPSLLASDLAMVQSLQAQGKAFFAWTNVWTTATPAQVSAWNTYALAAYLLVDNGVNDYYTFDSPFDSDRTTIFNPSELAALGAPTGSFTLTGGVYSRNFRNGSVTLNTTTNAAAIDVTQ